MLKLFGCLTAIVLAAVAGFIAFVLWLEEDDGLDDVEEPSFV